MKFRVIGGEPYIIEAPSAYDAKRFARIQNDTADVQIVADDSIAFVCLRWVGNDFSGGSGPNCKRLIVKVGEEDWRNLG